MQVKVRARLVKNQARFAVAWLVENIIRKESIIPNQVLFYVLIILNGLYNALVVQVPTQILESSLPPVGYQVFVWMAVFAPLATILGMILARVKKNLAEAGMVMQLFGDIGVCGVCTTFVVAVAYTSWWGAGNFAGTFVLASALGSTIFIVRDLLALLDRDRWVKAE